MIPEKLRKDVLRFVLVQEREKIPIEKEWQSKNNYGYEDEKLVKHIEKGGNYGVLCGVGNLIVIDADTEKIRDIVEKKLPKTFTVQTGGGGRHYYYFCDVAEKVVLKNGDTHLGEIQGRGSQVVGVSCIHPNGKEYGVIHDEEIFSIESDTIKKVFGMFFLREKKKKWKQIETDDDLKEIKRQVKVPDVMKWFGFDLSKNPTTCLWHSSKGEANFSYEDEQWHCFHCERSGNIFHLVMENEGVKFGVARQKIVDNFLMKEVEEQIIVDEDNQTTLFNVYDVYEKWLHVSDRRRIDLVLAVCLTRKIKGTKLWLLIVSHSGDWKSEQINALEDDKKITRLLKSFTSKTLVSGDKNAPDLAPQLKDKILLVPEMAQLLTLHPNEKAQIWAQLRDLYDGCAGKESGTGKSSSYNNLNVTFIGCSTPAIDSQILIHQALGSRELVYRPPKEDGTGFKETMKKVLYNEECEIQMREELKDVTQKFLSQKEYQKNIILSEEVILKIEKEANYLRYMRAPAEWDSYTGDLLNDAHPEMPTRILKQLKRLFIALKSLSPDYSDERALEVITQVINSSSFQNRVKVYEFLKDNAGEYTEYNVSNALKIGRKSVFRELNVLWNLGLVIKNVQETEIYGKIIEKSKWSVDNKYNMIRS